MRANEKDRDRRKTMTERKRDKRQEVKNISIKLTAQSIKEEEEGISERQTAGQRQQAGWLCSGNTQHTAWKANFCC
jgi:hypothetical protein